MQGSLTGVFVFSPCFSIDGCIKPSSWLGLKNQLLMSDDYFFAFKHTTGKSCDIYGLSNFNH